MVVTVSRRTPPGSLYEVLQDLYRRHLASHREPYLEQHAVPKVVRGQVEMFERYLPYLPPRGSVLDWGCRHAPDSCLLRAARGGAFDLFDCDFPPAEQFEVFHSYADLCYRRLDGPVQIPFADQQFDVVIGSGTLEHTAMDYESLKEVYRVLKPGGIFVIAYLPN